MNVKKIIMVALLGFLAASGAACSGAGPTPTRTPRAVAENGNATQTPWIIYVPVTNTPEPMTVTPLPTVTSSKPEQPTPKPATPRPTRTAATKAPTAAPSPTALPVTDIPAATPTPSCGQTYQVAALTFPANGDTRETKAGGGASKTIQFKWTPVSSNQLNPNIGYRVFIKSPSNQAAIYISHNGYLDKGMAILSQQATWGLTREDDVDAQWDVTVVMSSGGFDDNTGELLGTATPCGPSTGPWIIHLKVVK